MCVRANSAYIRLYIYIYNLLIEYIEYIFIQSFFDEFIYYNIHSFFCLADMMYLYIY